MPPFDTLAPTFRPHRRAPDAASLQGNQHVNPRDLGHRLRLLAAGLFLLAVLTHAAQAADRPRVGLVLGGGGARGAAHIGVLEVLERLRVPVDCVAGTSMGALIAGAWAAGISPAQMREEMARANWTDMFQDNPEFSELSYRNKRLSQRFLPGSEIGVTDDGLRPPPGVLLGQKIKLFFNSLVHANLGEREMQQLALPLSIIATDIGTGERVVFGDGSLTMAMRASMSVPGLLAPVEYRGRKLVDGGLVDNVPIREVRERCGAEVVIAVNVGSPLLRPEKVGSLLSVSTQMVNILTEQNVAQSLATLQPGDIHIKPDLEGIGAADFERHGETADRGRAAAQAAAARLQPLSVAPAQYAQWWSRIAARERPQPRVDEIEIARLQRVDPGAVRAHIRQQEGEPLDTAKLEHDLLRAFGDGWYGSVDYTLLSTRDRNILRITPLEKSWGPDYLRVGINLEVADQGATFDLRVGYHKTWLNRLGAELLLVGQIGSTMGAAAEFYQPFDAAQTLFVQPVLGIQRRISPVYEDDLKLAEYRLRTYAAEVALGSNLGRLGQARLGWLQKKLNFSLDTGLPFFPTGTTRYGGAFASVDLDQLNRLYFPSSGWAARLRYLAAADEDFSRLDASAAVAHTIGRYVLGAELSYTGSPSGQLPFFDASSLGGFLNMSAFAKGQLLGDDVTYAQLRAERIIGTFPIGLRGDLRLGLALEAARRGRSFTETRRPGWLNSTTLYVGGETPLGPVYLGYGYSTSGVWNVYFFLGAP
jgi:NTE family protein